MKIQWFGKVLVFAVFLVSLSKQEFCPSEDQALIIALLALHGGDKCELIVQKGVQQIAALEYTLNKVNNENDIKLDLKLFDTCSSSDEALKSALRGLVYAEQGCRKPPFFLGFLGPDDTESLRAVVPVTGVFKYPHVVPGAVRSYGLYNVINVETIDSSIRAQGIRLLLKDMNWASFFLVYTSDSHTTQIATYVIEPDEFCVIQSVLRVPSATSGSRDSSVAYNRLLTAIQQVEEAKVVVLSDTAESVENLLRFLEGKTNQTKFVIYVQGSGIIPWKTSKDLLKNVVILQETTKSNMISRKFLSYLENTELWSNYTIQNKEYGCKEDASGKGCQAFNIQIDPTVLPLTYSLHLYAKALKTAHANKCKKKAGKPIICTDLKNTPNDEWQKMLADTTAVVVDEESKTNNRIRFFMDLDDIIDVITYNEQGYFDTIGTIINGNDLDLRKTDGLLMISTPKEEQCADEEYKIVTDPPTKKPDLQEENGDKDNKSDNKADENLTNALNTIFNADNFGFYELISTLIGLAVGIVLLIVIVTCMVYRSFRVKQKPERYAESVSSYDGSPKRPPPKCKKGKKKNIERRESF